MPAAQRLLDVSFESDSKVCIITLNGTQNRINALFCKQFQQALDLALEKNVTAVVTRGQGKFFSTGLNISWLMNECSQGERKRFFPDVFYNLLARILTYPKPTVALINGYAYAGGFALALAHDFTFMKMDPKVNMCMNEVLLKCPIPEGMWRLLQTKMSFNWRLLRDITQYGRVIDSCFALENGIIDGHAKTEEELMSMALQKIQTIKDITCDASAILKMQSNAYTLEALNDRSDVPIDALFTVFKQKARL